MKRLVNFGDVLNFSTPSSNAPSRQRGEVVHVVGDDIAVVRNVFDMSRLHVVARTARRWHSAVSASPPLTLEEAIGAAVCLAVRR